MEASVTVRAGTHDSTMASRRAEETGWVFVTFFFILGSHFGFLGIESERHEENRKEDSNVG